MRTTTSREFVEWMVFINDEEQQRSKVESKADHYLAQIAAEIRRGNVKDPQKVKMDDMILTFKDESEEQDQNPEVSKRFWLSALGVNNK